MCVDEKIERNNGSSEGNSQEAGLRIDFVDNWHKQWPAVLKAIESTGQREALLVDHDGWLSARQCLLVAFEQEQIVGHLVFSIQPSGVSSGVPASADMRSLNARPRVDAHLDAMDVQPGLSGAQVRSLLMDAATRRARSLRCRSLIGFEIAN